MSARVKIKNVDILNMFKEVGPQRKSRNPMLICKYISLDDNKAYYAVDRLEESRGMWCIREDDFQKRVWIFKSWFRRYRGPNGERYVLDGNFMPCRWEELGLR